MKPVQLALPWARVARIAIEAAAWAALLLLAWDLPGDMRDAGAYYDLRLDDIYAHHTFLDTGYVYSPAFAVVTEPLRWLPPEVMDGVIRTASTVALGWLVTPYVGTALILVEYPGLRAELGIGNIDLLVTAVLVFILWKPWLWPTLLLTKVAPGVGLAWHLARREWRALGIAIGLTAGIAVLSLPFVGIGAWLEWWDALTGENIAIANEATAIPLGIRLAAGFVLAALAGLAGWAWFIPIAVAISFADPNVAHWLVIFAIPRLYLATRRHRSGSSDASPDQPARPAGGALNAT